MSLAHLFPSWKSIARLSNSLKAQSRPRRTLPRHTLPAPLIEGLEMRQLLSVAALAEVAGDSFGPASPPFGGELVVNQFNDAGRALLGAKVDYSLSMSVVIDGVFIEFSGESGAATATFSGCTELTVPGATDNPQQACVLATDTAPFAPNELVIISASDNAGKSDALMLTAAEAVAHGYVGVGQQTFPYSSNGFGQLSDSDGFFDVSFIATAAVSAQVTWFYYIPATISGTKFNDLNGVNGRDPGEPGLPGWTITITGDTEELTDNLGNILQPSTPIADFLAGIGLSNVIVTAGDGSYSFPSLPPGAYTLSEAPLPAGWSRTFPAAPGTYQITIGPDGAVIGQGSLSGNDFGNRQDAPTGFEGLGVGFWKNNAAKKGASAWAAPYAPDTKLSAIPGLALPAALGNLTMLQALKLGGGGINALLRQAVAAILNAAHPAITYPLAAVPDVVAAVNAAVGGGASAINTLKDLLDQYNNAGGGVDQQNRPV